MIIVKFLRQVRAGCRIPEDLSDMPIVSQVYCQPKMLYFNVFDAGRNNGLMICQGERTAPVLQQISDECPIRAEIIHVFAHSNDVTASVRWYGNMLGISADSARYTGDGWRLETAQGAPLYILDHRHNPIAPVSYDKLGGANVRNYPMFELGTSNIADARRWIEDRGGVILERDRKGQTQRSLYFQDPDGNINIVCETEER